MLCRGSLLFLDTEEIIFANIIAEDELLLTATLRFLHIMRTDEMNEKQLSRRDENDVLWQLLLCLAHK